MLLDPAYFDAEGYRLGVFTLQDHMDLADILGHLRSKWLAADEDHPKIREPFNGFHMGRVKAHLSVPEIIGDKRPRFKQLIIQLRAS
jgi:DNA adenine methylase